MQRLLCVYRCNKQRLAEEPAFRLPATGATQAYICCELPSYGLLLMCSTFFFGCAHNSSRFWAYGRVLKKHLHTWAGPVVLLSDKFAAMVKKTKKNIDLFNHCPSPLPSPNGRPRAPSWQHALDTFQTKPQDSSAKRAQASRGFTSSPKPSTVLHNEQITQPKFILFEQSQGEASLVARDLCLSAPVLGTEEAVEFPSEALYQTVLGS